MDKHVLHEIREVLYLQSELLRRLSDLLGKLETSGKAEDRGLSVREAAAALGISEPSVRRLIARGELRASRIGGRIVVPMSEVRRRLSAD